MMSTRDCPENRGSELNALRIKKMELEKKIAELTERHNKALILSLTEAMASMSSVLLPKLRLREIQVSRPETYTITEKSRLVQLYRQHVKPIPLLRKGTIWIYRNVYLSLRNIIARKFFQKRVGRWHELVSLREYVANKHAPSYLIFEAVQVHRPTPRVLPAEKQKLLAAGREICEFPPVYVAEIGDSLVYGGTNLVFAPDAVLHHDLYDFARDYTSEELHGRHVIDAEKLRMRLMRLDDAPVVVAEAANFLDACAGNYAHWLTEVLPRIAAFCSLAKFANVPIIIDAGLHANIMESLSIIVGSEREVIVLPVGRALKVERLLVTSATGYVPFDARNPKFKPTSDGDFSPSALQLVKEKCLAHIDQCEGRSLPDRVYLRRSLGVRKITNATEIEECIHESGYVMVDPEKLTFVQQLCLFRNVQYVTSPTGAALANVIFCEQGAKCTVMMAEHDLMVYRYWVNMFSPLGIQAEYTIGEISAPALDGIHSDYFVDPRAVREALA